MKKKNIILLFGILVLALGLLLVSCDPGGHRDSGNVRVRAYNNHGIAPSQARTVQAMQLLPLASEHASFSDYNTFYDLLGAKKGNITPSKFVLGYQITPIIKFDPLYNVTSFLLGSGAYDFTKGYTVNMGFDSPGEHFPTTFDIIGIRILFIPHYIIDDPYHFVEFAWPSELDFNTHASGYYASVNYGGPNSFNNGIATISWNKLDPQNIQDYFLANLFNYSLLNNGFAYIGSERKIYRFNYFLHESFGVGPNPYEGETPEIFIPFSPITWDTIGQSLTLHVSWDLDGIIERYEGATPAPDDDIFVLKRGWWNSLHLYATVE